MKIKLSIFILLASFQLQAQSSGYLGKRSIIEVEGLGNFPLFGILTHFDSPYYKKFGNSSLTQTKNYIDYGWRVSYARISNRNVGFGVEFGYDYQNITFPEYDNRVDIGYESVMFRHEMLDLSSVNITPKLIFSTRGGLVPVGFAHEIGIGYSSSKVVEKDYVIMATQNASLMTDSVKDYIHENYVDYGYRYSGVTFMYGMKMRVPLSKRLLLNYGFKYMLHLRNIFNDQVFTHSTIISNSMLQREIGRNTRVMNFISLNLGLAFAF